jgi:succinate-semialdehyde dehydrogenase / glutarate-semialdehyde dehydrogenase
MIPLQEPALLQSQCIIDGRRIGTPQLQVINPSTGAPVAQVPDLGGFETQQAVEAASAALPGWKDLTAKQRAQLLRRWFDLILANREDLAIILTSEQGKPRAEALAEIDYAASYVEFYAEEAKRVQGEILPPPEANARTLVLRQPVGVVAAITPWNFPAAMVTRKVAPALAAGCTVVLKPAPQTPLTALALAGLALRAGLPPGVLNVVTGNAVAIGSVLTTHPAVRLLTFTGSTAVGKLLMQQCSSTVKKVLLELGGNAPFIVFEDADIDAAVDGAIASKFRNSGQTCVCANRFYVHADVHDEFVDKLAVKARELRAGDGFEPHTTQGPLIDANAIAKVERHVRDAVCRGATVVTGGNRINRSLLFEPTVLTGMTADMLIAREETFGPVAAVFPFTREDEAIAAANESTAGLAAYIFTKSLDRSFRVMERLEVGMVGVNTGRMSTELAPFGGVKQSGNSREGSHHGILEFTELKYCSIGNLS